MAATEEKRREGGARSLSPEFWKQDVSMDPAAHVSAAAEGGHFSEEPTGFVSEEPLECHLYEDDDDDEDGHSLTREVPVSQGGDSDPDMYHSDEEPKELQLAAQDAVDAGDRVGRQLRRRPFRDGQAQELETAFHHKRFADVLRRIEFASVLCVPESREKVWFKNRRAKYWKAQREVLLRNAPPDSQDHIVIEKEE